MPSRLAPRNVERIACSQGGCQSWRNASAQVNRSTTAAMRVASSRRGTMRNAASMKNTTYATLAGPQLLTHQRPGPCLGAKPKARLTYGCPKRPVRQRKSVLWESRLVLPINSPVGPDRR